VIRTSFEFVEKLFKIERQGVEIGLYPVISDDRHRKHASNDGDATNMFRKNSIECLNGTSLGYTKNRCTNKYGERTWDRVAKPALKSRL